MRSKYSGFTLIELSISLMIIGILSAATYPIIKNYYLKDKGEKLANSLQPIAVAYSRYITNNFTALSNVLQNSAQGSQIQIPIQTLIDQAYVSKNTPLLTNYKQIPCLEISLDSNNMVQGVIVLRGDSTTKTQAMSTREISAALNQLGNVAGSVIDNNIYSNGRGWNLNPDLWLNNTKVINPYQISQSQNIYMDQTGLNENSYKCAGNSIANNSILLNLIGMSRNNDMLQPDNAVHRFTDNGTDNPDDKDNGNVMTGQLIMDATGDNSADHPNPEAPKGPHLLYNKHYALIFQNNPNCPPSDSQCLDTENNINKQLSIAYSTSNDGRKVVQITGFNKSANAPNNNPNQNPYVGSLQVLSLQPTLKIPVDTDGSAQGSSLTCDQYHKENIGRIAQMQPDDGQYTKLFTAQVMCQYNPLCSSDDGYCYLPTSNVVIRTHPSNPTTYTAPKGFFIINYETSDPFQPNAPYAITNCPGAGCGDNPSPNNLAVGCDQKGGFMDTERGYGAWRYLGASYVGGGGRYTYNSHGVPVTINAQQYNFQSYSWGSPAWCSGWYTNGGTRLSHIVNLDYVTITNDPSKLNTQTP
ncbi:MAG: prepilin-type N-terminal cleavage/methylation domain-containing protein [Neisseriaceae bacterium]|nr:MAG: prepilin-type N-terminal cleavage/methylation domain-containing protein [Neisseriaceae bacterium]